MEQNKSHCPSKSFCFPTYLKRMFEIVCFLISPDVCPCAFYMTAQTLLKLFELRAALSRMYAAFRKAQGTVPQADQSEVLLFVYLLAGLGCLILVTFTLGKSSRFYYLAGFFSVHFLKW